MRRAAAWRRWIASLLGAGFLPGAPGTWGTLGTAVLLYPLLLLAGLPAPLILVAGVVFFSGVAVAVGRFAQEDFGRKDPGPFVLDEAAGLCLTMLFLPVRERGGLLVTLLAAFLAFRLFDVTKPPPARQLERLPGGWGILLDDLAAAIYANLLCQIVLRLI